MLESAGGGNGFSEEEDSKREDCVMESPILPTTDLHLSDSPPDFLLKQGHSSYLTQNYPAMVAVLLVIWILLATVY